MQLVIFQILPTLRTLKGRDAVWLATLLFKWADTSLRAVVVMILVRDVTLNSMRMLCPGTSVVFLIDFTFAMNNTFLLNFLCSFIYYMWFILSLHYSIRILSESQLHIIEEIRYCFSNERTLSIIKQMIKRQKHSIGSVFTMHLGELVTMKDEEL